MIMPHSVVDTDKARALMLPWVHYSCPLFQLPLGSYNDSLKISSMYTILHHKSMGFMIFTIENFYEFLPIRE